MLELGSSYDHKLTSLDFGTPLQSADGPHPINSFSLSKTITLSSMDMSA